MFFRIVIAIIGISAAASITSSVPLNKRILNGTPIKEGDIPAFATGWKEIYEGGVIIGGCGGVLIGPQTVLTAAHCVEPFRESKDLYVGGIEINTGKHVKFAKGVKYSGYNQSAGINDVGLVFLREKAEGTYAIIEGTSYPEEGSKLTVAGHGATEVGGGVSSGTLLKVEVTMGSQAECGIHKNDGRGAFDPNAQVCAIDNGYSACAGDSGGPLYSGSGKDMLVVGLVSGPGIKSICGEKGTFQYYTFIKPFIPWINSEIKRFEQDEANLTSVSGRICS